MSEAPLPFADETLQPHNPEISQTFVGFNTLGEVVAGIYDSCSPKSEAQPKLTTLLDHPLIESVYSHGHDYKFNVFRYGSDGRERAPLQYVFDHYPTGVGKSGVPVYKLGANLPYAHKDPDTQEVTTGYAQLAYTWRVRRDRGIKLKIREEAELADVPPSLFKTIAKDVLRISRALDAAKVRATGEENR